MLFSIPTLYDRSRTVYASIRARLTGADGEIWPNNLRITGKVIAMAAHEGDLRSSFIFRQIFSSTAEGDYLDLHAYEVGLVRKPALGASGLVVFAATPGTVVPAGTRVVRSDGAFYVSGAAATAAGNSVSIPVTAEVPGLAGNTVPGASFTLASTLDGLAATGLSDVAGLGGGADQEGDEALRARILYRKRNRPRGGALADYIEWATELTFVAQAFAQGWSPGAGAVSIWPLKAGSGTACIPTLAECEQVAAYLETRRPAAATVYIQQAAARSIDVQIQKLDPNTVAVQAEIRAELQDEFDDRAVIALPSGAGATFSRSWIDEAISAAVGENSHLLLQPPGDVVLNPGEFPVLGNVSFV